MRKVPSWTKTFFYVKSCSLALEAAFLPSTLMPFESNERLTSRPGLADAATTKDLSMKIGILVRRGLRFRNLVAAWISQRIQPLSPRPSLLCAYIGNMDDPLRACKATWDLEAFITVMKKMI
jgi:hypothetical protein